MNIIGSFVSPYVRKVLACLELKGLDYEVDPITPFFGNDEFSRLSPLRRIPVLIDGDIGAVRFHASSAHISTRPMPATPLLPEGSAGPRPRPLARGICRHAARRRVHLGPVLPEGGSPPGVERGTGRQERVAKVADRGCARRARLSGGRAAGLRAICSARSASPTSRIASFFRQRALCRLRARCRRAGRRSRASSEHVLAQPRVREDAWASRRSS